MLSTIYQIKIENMPNHLKISSSLLLLSLVALPLLPLQGGEKISFTQTRQKHSSSSLSSSIKEFSFQPSDEEEILLESLFTDPDLFESPEKMKEAGFIVNRRVHEELMVATHPLLKKYIFKKYTNKIPHEVQLAKYIHRINGARIIETHLTKYKFKHLVVPKKWIYPLPSHYGEESYLVVAEYLPICKGDDHRSGENGQRYYNMSKEVLKELIYLMHKLGGCDAWPRNQPFTKDGKIAFVDTEHVGEKKRHFARHIIPRLNPDLQKYANGLLRKLK